jgi:hypothetical protein
MEFKFKHPKTGEVRVVNLTESEIQHYLDDVLYDELSCDCEPEGENSFTECNCEDYLCEFVIEDRS